MKQTILLLMISIGLTTLHAQEGYLVYTLQGNITVKDGGTDGKAKVGQMLSDKAEVSVGTGGAISLICTQSHLVTLNKAGKYVLNSYNKECGEGKSSVTGNYLKYVWNQLTQKPGTPEKNRKQYMNNVGAVSRSINSIWIDPRLDTVKYASGSFPLTWKSYGDEEQFEFLLYGEKDIQVPILVVPTTQKQIAISDILPKMKPGEKYFWTAIVKGSTNDERKILHYVSNDSYKEFLKELEQPNGVFEDEAARSFRIGFLLEQAHYLPQAFEYYKKSSSPATRYDHLRFHAGCVQERLWFESITILISLTF